MWILKKVGSGALSGLMLDLIFLNYFEGVFFRISNPFGGPILIPFLTRRGKVDLTCPKIKNCKKKSEFLERKMEVKQFFFSCLVSILAFEQKTSCEWAINKFKKTNLAQYKRFEKQFLSILNLYLIIFSIF